MAESVPVFDLSGQTALVTGASQGLGRRMALTLARAGARVALVSRRKEELDQLKMEIEEFGGQALSLPFDIQLVEEIKRGFDICEAHLGPVDILINNAAVTGAAAIADITPEFFDTTINTNARAPFFLSQEAGMRMIARGQGGRIVNIASVGAFKPFNGATAYCMSKAAVVMMTRSMAMEWARDNLDININAICLGYFKTEMSTKWFESPEGQESLQSVLRRRISNAEDLDALVLLLSSREHSRVITGASFTVDDGLSL